MRLLRTVCVFCGSSSGSKDIFTSATVELGAEMARRGLNLVYGGASVGLMGVVADAVLSAGGSATGVITESLAGHEIAHGELNHLHVVQTMHERKAAMAELSDAFVMAPGGFGTYEEFMEAITWSQLGIHDKPCGILNVDGFYDHLLAFLAQVVDQGFIKERQLERIVVTDDPGQLLDGMAALVETP